MNNFFKCLNINNFFVRTALIFSILLFCSALSFGGVKYYQSTKINNDGSLSIYITYSAPTTEITKSKGLIGKFPFNANSIREYFNFPDVEITKAVIYKDTQDTNETRAAIRFEAKNISKISNAKSFNGITARLFSSDSGLVFTWAVPSKYIESNIIETYHFIVTSEPEIRSTTGTLKDKEIQWFVFGNKTDPRGYNFTTTVKSDVKITQAAGNDDKQTDNKKDGGCGLFGIELPVIMLGGFALSYRLNKKN
ncbi:MAG: hypothetical protein M3R36_11925 [Bacteroidota bacterium]|nr:hypothetical protein [Bacteroidota bacterium]